MASSQACKAFQYRVFTGIEDIRLVTLHPATFNDDLCIEVAHGTLGEQPTPQYEALSYVWGDTTDIAQVYVQRPSEETPSGLSLRLYNTDAESSWTLDVTQALSTALRHLRYIDRPRCLWIDAICINQADNAEKSKQVARMGDVYRLAHRTIIWLGAEENESSKALNAMVGLGSQVEVTNWNTTSMRPSASARDPRIADRGGSLPLEGPEMCAVYHVFCRPWFDRLWVRQEITLSNAKASVVCGNLSVSWTAFRAGWLCVHQKEWRSFAYSSQLRDRLDLLFGFLAQPPFVPIHGLRLHFGSARCSDPRDRIYAVTSVVKELSDIGIVPDYSKGANAVYEEVVVKYMVSHGDLWILRQCALREGQTSGPSWVPDWSTGNREGFRIGKLFAFSQLSVKHSLPRNGRLTVEGVSCGTVNSLKTLDTAPGMPLIQVWHRIEDLVRGVELDRPYVGGGSLLGAYIRALVGDQFFDVFHFGPECTKQDWRRDTEVAVMAFLRDRPSGESHIDVEDRMIRYMLETTAKTLAHGGQVFTTNTGYVGVAGPFSKLGDEAWVLLGNCTPLILRPTPGDDRLVVSDCCIPGVNHGEAFLGPFPNRFRQAWAHSNLFPIFVDPETGHTTYEDPRLRRLNVDLQAFRNYLSRQLGGLLEIQSDDLRRIGVPLRSLELI